MTPTSTASLARTLTQDSPDLYRLLVESVRDYAIFALDATGHIITWNAGAERLKGYKASEIIGRHFSVFYSEGERTAGKPERELEIAERYGRVEDEGWRLRKDGTRFWAHVVITALRDEAGELVGFAKVTGDITERMMAEEALSESEERLRLMVQTVKDYGIFMLDVHGNIATWNDGAAQMKGYEANEIIGQHFSRFYPADDVARGKPDHELTVALREGKYEEEGWRVRKDGSRFWANVVITTVRNADGRHIGFAKVTRDLTERRAAEKRALSDARHLAAEEAARYTAEERAEELSTLLAQLKRQAEELQYRTREAEEANRVKSDFLATMSHELRTPLNAIGGYTQLLELGLRGPVTEDQQRDLERIRTSQRHLMAIINNILNYSQIESGQLSYEMGNVPVQDVVADVAVLITPLAAAKGVVFEEMPCPEGAVIHADRAKVEQILINLLSNAVKFTDSGGKVTLECRLDPNRVMIAVKDTGIGVEADKRETIFDPFVQIGRSLTQSMEGTGLGLAISRDLARGMDGEVTVESEPGKGSVFRLILPRAAQDQLNGDSPASPAG